MNSPSTKEAASRTNRKKDAAIYKSAADAVENLDISSTMAFCCNAIFFTATGGTGNWGFRDDNPLVERFHAVFKPEWQSQDAGYFGVQTQENKNIRVLALCFMAAMVEAGDA